MHCEDYPCCGHELGCCPPTDENGKQTHMVCTCGALVPLTSRSSLCRACLASFDDGDDCERDYAEDDEDDGDYAEDEDDYADDAF